MSAVVLDHPPSTGEITGRPAFRRGPVSLRWRIRHLVVALAALALTVLLAAIGLGMGDYPITPLRVLAILVGAGDRLEQLVVLDLRLPRTVAALVVGFALGVSGAITQTVARNPLASPDILGITAGASAGAVAAIVLTGSAGAVTGFASSVGVPASALIGGLLTSVVIYGLAWRRGLDGYRLVLVGIGIGAVLTGVTSWLLTRAEINDAARATVWLNGSLNGRGWEQILPVLIAVGILAPLLVLLSWQLGVLNLGDDVARGLGLRLEPARLVVLLVAVLLASVATAAAGPIAFVALVCPQLARLLIGTDRPPLLVSGILAMALVAGSDVLARTVLSDTPLPVGIVTAILGAPYLLFLLARTNRRATL